MAGSFGYEKEHYEWSMKMRERRLFPAAQRWAEGGVVVTNGFSCRHQLKEGTGIDALHWVEVVRGTNDFYNSL